MQGGTNWILVRDYNQQLVLEIIREREGATRGEIVEGTGLTAQTVSNIVKRFLDQGLVLEAGKEPSDGGGKRRVILKVNPGAGYAAGVQIDRDEVSCLVVDLEGRVVAGPAHHALQEQDPSAVISRAVDILDGLVREGGVDPARILGLGVACPGPLDPSAGVVYGPPGMPGWDEVRLKEALEARTGYPVVVDNDAVAAAVGERWVGRARGTKNFAFVYMGWGMGAGLFVEGQVCRGSMGAAGEIGHMPLDPGGPECPCGNRGCLIRYCSSRDIVSRVEERLRRAEPSSLGEPFRGNGGVGFGAVCGAALAGDGLARDELGRAGQMLGNALVALANMLDLELVVLGGRTFGPAEAIFLPEAERALGERILYPERRTIRVEPSTAGEDAGAVGAASLVLHSVYAPRLIGLKAR